MFYANEGYVVTLMNGGKLVLRQNGEILHINYIGKVKTFPSSVLGFVEVGKFYREKQFIPLKEAVKTLKGSLTGKKGKSKYVLKVGVENHPWFEELELPTYKVWSFSQGLRLLSIYETVLAAFDDSAYCFCLPDEVKKLQGAKFRYPAGRLEDIDFGSEDEFLACTAEIGKYYDLEPKVEILKRQNGVPFKVVVVEVGNIIWALENMYDISLKHIQAELNRPEPSLKEEIEKEKERFEKIQQQLLFIGQPWFLNMDGKLMNAIGMHSFLDQQKEHIHSIILFGVIPSINDLIYSCSEKTLDGMWTEENGYTGTLLGTFWKG